MIRKYLDMFKYVYRQFGSDGTGSIEFRIYVAMFFFIHESAKVTLFC